MHASWPSEYLVLGLLAEKPMHGYHLARLLDTETALPEIWRLKRSEVYFLLRKLLDLGYVAETAGQDPAAGPARVVYAPTPQGEAALAAWLAAPVKTPRDLRAAFLAKLYLALRRDRGLAIALLAAQRQALVGWEERLAGTAEAGSFMALVQKLRLAQVQAELAALADIQTTIEEAVN